MVIYMLGWHWEHPAPFAIERPNGLHGTQLLVIRSKGRIVMGEQEYHVTPNTAFLVSSCMPHCLYSEDGDYCDDWIRFSVEQEDYALIESLGVEWNVPVPLPDDSISELIRAAEIIFKSDVPEKQQTLHHILTAILLHIKSCYKPAKKRPHNYYDAALDRIRREIQENPAADWSLPVIAESQGLSEAHFRRLYKNRFGISCSKDIWTSRMEYAKQLLLTTELSVSEIADRCGYQTGEHFSRSFAKYACVSPAKYRATHKE